MVRERLRRGGPFHRATFGHVFHVCGSAQSKQTQFVATWKVEQVYHVHVVHVHVHVCTHVHVVHACTHVHVVHAYMCTCTGRYPGNVASYKQ